MSMNLSTVSLKFIQEDLSAFIGIQSPMASVNVCTMDEAIRSLRDKGEEKVRYRVDRHHPSIKIGTCLQLNGIEKPCVLEVGDGSIITLFDKTPFPVKDTDVVCPHFLELKWANGCRFNCSWCYLNGTLRFRPMGKKPYLKNKDKIIKHIISFLRNVEIPSILNSGELSDSLVFEGNGFSLSKDIVPLFQSQSRHKLLILTKSRNVKGLLESDSQESIVTSFSLNGLKVAAQWEKGAPTPVQRVKAAKQLQEAGYRVRIRIDPIVPIDTWREDYRKIIDIIFENIDPERITLGSLRGLQSTLNNSMDTSWVRFLDDTSNWGLKISHEKRLEMYSFIIDHLTKKYSYESIALCKESMKIWKDLNIDFKEMKCNCIH